METKRGNMMHYSKWPKIVKVLFHIIMWIFIILLGAIFAGATNDTTKTIISFIYIGFLGLEIAAIVIDVNERKKKNILRNSNIEKDNKSTQEYSKKSGLLKDYENFFERAPYHRENWLRIFGYKRDFKLDEAFNFQFTSSREIEIDFIDAELHISINGILIGKMNDNDLVGHLNKYWDDKDYDVLAVMQEINYSNRTGKIQINFYHKIQLEDNPKVQIVESRLIKVEENYKEIDKCKPGDFLKVYRKDKTLMTFYVTDQYGNTLGTCKKDVSKLINEYFENGFVIVQMKETIDQASYVDAILKFYFIQKNV